MAATLDVEKLLWVPKPIITVPGLIRADIFDRYEYQWKYVVGGMAGGGKTHTMSEFVKRLNRDLFDDGAGLPYSLDTKVEEFDDDDDPDY